MVTYLMAFELVAKQDSIVHTHGRSKAHLLTREGKEKSIHHPLQVPPSSDPGQPTNITS